MGEVRSYVDIVVGHFTELSIKSTGPNLFIKIIKACYSFINATVAASFNWRRYVTVIANLCRATLETHQRRRPDLTTLNHYRIEWFSGRLLVSLLEIDNSKDSVLDRGIWGVCDNQVTLRNRGKKFATRYEWGIRSHNSLRKDGTQPVRQLFTSIIVSIVFISKYAHRFSISLEYDHKNVQNTNSKHISRSSRSCVQLPTMATYRFKFNWTEFHSHSLTCQHQHQMNSVLQQWNTARFIQKSTCQPQRSNWPANSCLWFPTNWIV